jgi:hypothetical protein
LSEEKPGYKVAADGHTYHKSATANATTAPTNEATLANADDTLGLNAAQAEFVTLVDYHWHLEGAVGITEDFFIEHYGYTSTEFTQLVNTPVVLSKLTSRGIPPHLLKKDVFTEKQAQRVKLLPLQLKAANVLMDLTDTRPTKKKLQDIGVKTAQYQAWLKDPAFQDYLKQRAEGLLGDIQHEAALALADKVMAGDMKAIEYYNEMTGRFVRQSASGNGTSTHDVQQLIIRVIEIIVDEVPDAETANRIAGRMRGLVMGHQVAGVIEGETIEKPEIAAARPDTPEIQALKAKGLGYNS